MVVVVALTHKTLSLGGRTGYERHIKAYKTPVQKKASIGRGQEGADGVNLDGKVIVVTG